MVLKKLNYLPHEEVKIYQQKSQVLLLAVNNVPSAKGIVTGKIFEYLQAQRPIVAIAPTDGDVAAVLEETKSGAVVGFDDTESLKKILVDLYQEYQNGSLKIKAIGVEKYHRKALTEALVNIIKK